MLLLFLMLYIIVWTPLRGLLWTPLLRLAFHTCARTTPPSDAIFALLAVGAKQAPVLPLLAYLHCFTTIPYVTIVVNKLEKQGCVFHEQWRRHFHLFLARPLLAPCKCNDLHAQ